MKKTLLVCTMLLSTSTMAFVSNQTSILNNKVFEMKTATEMIKISFNDNIATLKTPCYDAVGIYSVDELEENTFKINFALQEYQNVTNYCDDKEYVKNLSKVALKSLNFNHQVEVKTHDLFNVQINMYSRYGDISSYDLKLM